MIDERDILTLIFVAFLQDYIILPAHTVEAVTLWPGGEACSAKSPSLSMISWLWWR